MHLGGEYLSLYLCWSFCLCLVPSCLLHADCYVMHQSSAQGGDTIPITREKHVQWYVGLLMSSLCRTHIHTILSQMDAGCASFFVFLMFCFLSLWPPLPCQLPLSGKSNYGPRSSLVLMPKGAGAACIWQLVQPWRQIRWWPWWENVAPYVFVTERR